MRRRFLLFRAQPYLHSAEFRRGRLRQTQRHAQRTRHRVDGDHTKRRRRPIKKNQRFIPQRRLRALHGPQKKIRNENRTKRHPSSRRAHQPKLSPASSPFLASLLPILPADFLAALLAEATAQTQASFLPRRTDRNSLRSALFLPRTRLGDSTHQ